jgi:hypothetical protein
MLERRQGLDPGAVTYAVLWRNQQATVSQAALMSPVLSPLVIIFGFFRLTCPAGFCSLPTKQAIHFSTAFYIPSHGPQLK